MDFFTSKISSLCLLITLAIGLGFLAFRNQREKVIQTWKNEKLEVFGLSILSFITLWIFRTLLIKIASSLSSVTSPVNQQLIEKQVRNGIGPKIFLGFSLLILAPLVEELIFRWLIFEFLGNNYFSVLVSALTFGFYHYQGETSPTALLVFLVYPLTGFAFAFIYKKKSNIVYPIALHFCNNLIAFAFIIQKIMY